jgi:hypothetical protein
MHSTKEQGAMKRFGSAAWNGEIAFLALLRASACRMRQPLLMFLRPDPIAHVDKAAAERASPEMLGPRSTAVRSPACRYIFLLDLAASCSLFWSSSMPYAALLNRCKVILYAPRRTSSPRRSAPRSASHNATQHLFSPTRVKKIRPRFSEARSHTARGVHPTVLPSSSIL